MPYKDRGKLRVFLKAYRAGPYREKHRENTRKWRAANPRKLRASQRATELKSKYGLSIDQWEMLLAAQDFSCAICGTDKPGGRWNRWHTDHCHREKYVRGILCASCNLMLGYARDNPATLCAAIKYLSGKTEW